VRGSFTHRQFFKPEVALSADADNAQPVLTDLCAPLGMGS